jgi:hypothetical protein
MSTPIYHLGLVRDAENRVLTLEIADSIDQLNCELWMYYGERITTIARLRQVRAKILEQINATYGTNFQRLRLRRVASGDYTAGHHKVLG